MKKCPRCPSIEATVNFDYRFHDFFKCNDCSYEFYQRIADCCRHPEVIVTIEHRQDNLLRLYHQCLNCGGAFKTKPLSQKQFSKHIKSEFSQSRFEDWDANRDAENNRLREFVKVNNTATSHYYKYQVYLRSPQWKEKRELVMSRDNSTCQHCKNVPATEVHHLTYENLFKEPLEDLISLCSSCHALEHK